MTNITAADMVNFLVQEGSNYLESICEDGASGQTLPEAHLRLDMPWSGLPSSWHAGGFLSDNPRLLMD